MPALIPPSLLSSIFSELPSVLLFIFVDEYGEL
jgi:hypothetical protein